MYKDVLNPNDDFTGRDILILTLGEWKLKHLARTKFYNHWGYDCSTLVTFVKKLLLLVNGSFGKDLKVL